MTRAAIYTRISLDGEKRSVGVARQEADARSQADERGWVVTNVYADNNISAFKADHRPAFEAMLADARQGLFDVLLCYHPDRLSRNIRSAEYQHLYDALATARIPIRDAEDAEYTLWTASGDRAFAEEIVAAQHQSKRASERIRRAQAAKKRAGLPASQLTVYGYRATEEKSRVGEEAELEAVKEMFERFWRGESYKAIADALNEREAPGYFRYQVEAREPWTGPRVRLMLIQPRFAGLQGPTRRDVKQPLYDWGRRLDEKGGWPAVVTPDEWVHTLKVIDDVARLRGGGGRQAQVELASAKRRNFKGLLSAIARCEEADCAMFLNTTNPDRRQVYCCPHMRFTREELERYVERLLIHRLGQKDVAEAVRKAREKTGDSEREVWRADIRALRMKADLATEDYTAGLLTREQMLSVVSGCNRRVEALEARLAAAEPLLLENTPLGWLGQGDSPKRLWGRLTLAERRMLILAFVSRLVILTDPTRKGRGWKPPQVAGTGSVRVEWVGAT